ncbi:hypothetical protein O3P69_016447 [Scylla paramamosain]|uniref:Uncharacterized protein n=1 Tax=Scylla paramamosain TaxID=85552 RepID=A0AAW0TDX1_SCYPA
MTPRRLITQALQYGGKIPVSGFIARMRNGRWMKGTDWCSSGGGGCGGGGGGGGGGRGSGPTWGAGLYIERGLAATLQTSPADINIAKSMAGYRGGRQGMERSGKGGEGERKGREGRIGVSEEARGGVSVEGK